MQDLLDQLKIKATLKNKQSNGNLIKYLLELKPGGKISAIEKNSRELALNLKLHSIPTVRLLPEQGLISVEAITKKPKFVDYSELKHHLQASSYSLPVLLGKSHEGQNVITDLASFPHLIISGTTGSGKSVMLHSIICSLIESSAAVNLALIDPKLVEFSYYNDIKQLMYPVVHSSTDANYMLNDLLDEMNDRFSKMRKKAANNIGNYNKKSRKKLPYIVLIIDEFADLMQNKGKEFSNNLTTLAQKSRACGIHIVIATQYPTVNIVNGNIKANFPARISCKVASAINSRVVLDQNGAETLLGNGDAFMNSNQYDMLRFQGAFISQEKIKVIAENNKRAWYKRGILK